MNKHVPDIDRCKRMAGLGIGFPSVKFRHVRRMWKNDWEITTDNPSVTTNYPAPLVSEMLERMPAISIRKTPTTYYIEWSTYEDKGNESLANVCADFLIWKKENKL